jgi:hypothetical protein
MGFRSRQSWCKVDDIDIIVLELNRRLLPEGMWISASAQGTISLLFT